jgi:hypothetical protein
MVYSKEKDSFVETVKKALNYKLDFNVCIPEWDEEFEKTFNEIKTL